MEGVPLYSCRIAALQRNVVMGQNLPPEDTDDLTACAFWVRYTAVLMRHVLLRRNWIGVCPGN